jgi:hypothetical protein
MHVFDEIERRKEDFNHLCENQKVRYLYAFGSSTTGKFKKDSSDIDLLVEINENDPMQRGEQLILLWDML